MATTERYRGPRRARALNESSLLAKLESENIDVLWERLRNRAYPATVLREEALEIERRYPADAANIRRAAAAAATRRVDLLGSGPVDLGTPIDWHSDFKTGRRWPLDHARSIDYSDLQSGSDVKTPWELSRLQWLIPAGQAFLLDGDDTGPTLARSVLDEWLDANPYGKGVNWAIAMEAALRIISWTWLFHVFSGSEAWSAHDFRVDFLRGLYLHGDFVERNLERSDINGNHYAADAAGLVFAGLFFGDGEHPRVWAKTGWEILCDELPRQVHADGVDFEASAAYHRLVAELFLLPALYRRALGLTVPDAYRGRLAAMGRFAAAYLPPDGLAPLWGDADDGRALPLGGQPLGDHRYLPALIGAGLDEPDLRIDLGGSQSEVAWLLGPSAATTLRPQEPESGAASFSNGGVYILAGRGDHVFIDCGPVGLAGRGGHGHNDCLSFEAVLDGTRLVSDAGSYVYTASPELRNRFRSTASHNTPLVDGVEQNRIPESLWQLSDDAQPEVTAFAEDGDTIVFRGSHTGYLRLSDPVRPLRTIALERHLHALLVHDSLEASGSHQIEIPLLLAPGVQADTGETTLTLTANGVSFELMWRGSEGWSHALERGWISPSYGIRTETTRLVWRRTGRDARLTITIAPAQADSAVVRRWADEIITT